MGWLIKTGEYSDRLDWLYAISALAVMLLSHPRQRRSFYYAGVLNLGTALYFVADHHNWFDRPAWASTWAAADTHLAKQLAYSSTAQNCHRYVAGTDTNKENGSTGENGWNTVTPW